MPESIQPPPVTTGQVPQPMDGRQTYNLVTDTVTGANIRLKDNLFQAIVIISFAVICAVIGLCVAGPRDRLGYTLVGGFIGVVAGLFASGIFLMIFRAVRHAGGHHD